MTTFTYRTDPPVQARVDVLVLPVFEGPEAGPGVKDVRGADLVALFKDAGLKGKLGETLTVPNVDIEGLAARSVVLVGLGKKEKVGTNTLRRAIGRAAPSLAKRKSLATTLPQVVGRGVEGAVQATVEGILLGSYRFDSYKSGKREESAPERRVLESVVVLGPSRWNARAVKQAIARAEIVSDAACFARDLVNTPAKECTPAYLAEQARKMAREVGLEVKVWTEKELEKGGFGGILGVGQGSANPPRMIELKYGGAAASRAPIALSGKGVSFDSGGLSLKDGTNMEWMKDDMGGAASILGTMKAIARLKPRVNVIAAIPCAENMPGGRAIHPGDVLRHRGGKTSEVLNTDAEGRLILADALAYLAEGKPRVIIDTATLTGACVVALGDEITGVFGNDRGLAHELVAAGEAVGEPAWELPLWEDYKPLIESEIADIRNIGKRSGGAITAALFLAEFAGDTPWAHLDIAGPAFTDIGGDYTPKGGTGVPVRLLVRYILDQANRPASAARSRA